MRTPFVTLYLLPFLLDKASPTASNDLEGLDHIYPTNLTAGDGRIPLTLGLMVSFSGSYVIKGAIPGIQLAVDIVNGGGILPGYRLQYSLTDSKCDQTVTLTQFFEDIVWSNPPKVGFIGAGCENATIETAKISYFFNLTQISCDSSSPEEEDRNRFKRYFQILPNDIHLSQALAAIMDTFNWTKLHAIELEYGLFVQTLDLLISLEQKRDNGHNITFTSYSGGYHSANSLSAILRNKQAFDTESRIFYLAMYLNDTRRVLCEAYHQKKTHPLYVLITLGWYSDGWWDSNVVNCTREQMEAALDRSLAITLDAEIADENMTTSSGLNFTQYRELYVKGVNRLNLPDVYDGEPCFDAVWAYALALNKTIQDLRDDPTFNRQAAAASLLPPNSTFFMENFTYGNSVILERMYQHLSNVSFVGITGNLSFNSNGIRNPNRIRIQQYRFNSTKQLQKFDIAFVELDQNGQTAGFHFYPGQSVETTWPSGVPHDGTLKRSTAIIEVGITITMYLLAVVGLVLAVICLVLAMVFRKHKLIRLTSPNLNYIMNGGCMVLYASIFFLAIQSQDETITTAICNVRVWLWAIGYSLAFGPVLGKMYRVYYIFNNPKPNKKKVVKDWMLVVVICVMVGLDIALLVIVTAVPELRTTANLRQSTENPTTVTGVFRDTTINCIFVCDSKKGYTIWHGVLFGYKALIQVVAILLAFGTRKVKVKGLDDSKYIAAIIYVTSICLVVVIISFMTLQDKVNTVAAIYSFGFWCGATTILLLVFVPKLYGAYKDPEGKMIFPGTVVQTELEHEKISVLERRIRDLQLQLSHEHEVCQEMKRLTLVSGSAMGSVEVVNQNGEDHGSNQTLTPTITVTSCL